jgi:hypothetical protein
MDPTVPFQELVDLVNKIKITYNPLDDMYNIMKLGDIIYKANKYQQWKECSDLHECILVELEKNIPEFSYSREELHNKINSFLEKNVSPNSTKHDLLNYFSNIYISLNTLQGREYLEFRVSLKYLLDKVYSKYTIKWDELDAKFNTLLTLIEEKFGHLEHDDEYVELSNKIFGFMDEVDELFKPFYKYNKDYVDNGYLERDYKMCFNIIMTKHEVDSSTENLLISSIYLTNLELHKLNVSIKITQQKLFTPVI